MRDLSRRNSNTLAIHQLAKEGFEVFTPMTRMVMTIGRRRQCREVPVIQDLLFVHAAKPQLDHFVEIYQNLQYRYLRGHSICDPMTVREDEMQRFIHAVESTETPAYYSPGEITEAMLGKQVRIIGGPLDGYEGRLLSVKGMRKRRLLVELPGLITAAIEVQPEFIRLL